MGDNSKETLIETVAGAKTRREFVRTSAKVAVTAPAVALLLNASTKPAAAQNNTTAYQASQSHILDDYTFGNEREDIDALGQHQNTNPLNQTPEQDDHVP